MFCWKMLGEDIAVSSVSPPSTPPGPISPLIKMSLAVLISFVMTGCLITREPNYQEAPNFPPSVEDVPNTRYPMRQLIVWTPTMGGSEDAGAAPMGLPLEALVRDQNIDRPLVWQAYVNYVRGDPFPDPAPFRSRTLAPSEPPITMPGDDPPDPIDRTERVVEFEVAGPTHRGGGLLSGRAPRLLPVSALAQQLQPRQGAGHRLGDVVRRGAGRRRLVRSRELHWGTELRTVASIASASLLAATIAGCALASSGPPINRCAADAECAGASRCDLAREMCVAAMPETLQIALELVPSTDPMGGRSTVRLADGPFELTGRHNYPLTIPVEVPTSGLLHDAFGEPVTAEVRFVPASPIPGLPGAPVTAQSTGEEIIDGGGVRTNFNARLRRGWVYDIDIRPTGDWRSRFPPLQRSGYLTPENGAINYLDGELLTFDPVCSRADLASLMRGELVDCGYGWFQGVVVNGDGAPQDGLLVRAISPTGTVISSTHTTGAELQSPCDPEHPGEEPGYFCVVMSVTDWLAPTTWFFEVAPTSSRMEEGGPEATFVVDPVGLFEDGGLVSILTPAVDRAVLYRGTVETVPEAGSRPLPDAVIRFTSVDILDDTTGIVGSYTTSTESEADGSFEARLLPGTYEVVITPVDLEGEFAVLRREDIVINPTGEPPPAGADWTIMGQLFQVPERGRFSGTILTASAEGMRNAEVRARSLADDRDGTLDSAALYARSSTTLSDFEGRFGLRLDIGTYDVVVQPPRETNFPWTILPPIEIGGSEAFGRDIELASPVPITRHGRVSQHRRLHHPRRRRHRECLRDSSSPTAARARSTSGKRAPTTTAHTPCCCRPRCRLARAVSFT